MCDSIKQNGDSGSGEPAGGVGGGPPGGSRGSVRKSRHEVGSRAVEGRAAALFFGVQKWVNRLGFGTMRRTFVGKTQCLLHVGCPSDSSAGGSIEFATVPSGLLGFACAADPAEVPPAAFRRGRGGLLQSRAQVLSTCES